MSATPRIGWLFAYDWDREALQRLHGQLARCDHAGFDLFSFPEQLRLPGFDLERFAARQAARARRRGWRAVLSHHEQFGALAAALVAERLGLPGASPASILAAQHKLHARSVLQRVAPEANLRCTALDPAHATEFPDDLRFPLFAKPVKGAFSVLARRVETRAELRSLSELGAYERWLATQLVRPFERVRRARLPEAGSADRLLLEEPIAPHTAQYNLDGWVQHGEVHALGVVDAIMYPGTQAFMRWEHPSRLDPLVQERALGIARRFLAAIGYTHGFFNLEFFHEEASDRLVVIECNPRLAAQFSDLYRRVQGLDAHAMAVALALDESPRTAPRVAPCAGVAASLVWRVLDPAQPVPPLPGSAQRAALARHFPDALLLCYPKQRAALARDFRWTGSHRYGILHLGAGDREELRRHCEQASALLGWPAAPYSDHAVPASRHRPVPAAFAARAASAEASRT